MINLLQNKLESLDWTAPAFKCDQKNKNKNKNKKKKKERKKGKEKKLAKHQFETLLKVKFMFLKSLLKINKWTGHRLF